jgi:hypothetical protein
MAKKDAIFDYGSNFDTSSYLNGIGKDWDNCVGSSIDIRFDLSWRGTPRAESHLHSASSPAAISGWDVGKFKRLSYADIPLQDYSAYDPPVSNKDGFVSMSHQLLYDVKRAFNLPNQENLATWQDDYCAQVNPDEHHYLWHQSAGRTPWPMVMSHPTKGGFRSADAEGNPLEDKDMRCALMIPIRGYTQIYGGDDNEDTMTVWPTSTDIDAMNTHYKTLEDANTPAADWTNPPKVGTAFDQTSKLLLLNFENYFQGKNVPEEITTSTLVLVIAWSSHSYAEIKALIDAAI